MRDSWISKGLAVVVLTAMVLARANAQVDNARYTDYPGDGVRLGNGWSSLKASKTWDSCIDQFTEGSDAGEAREVQKLKRVWDHEELNEELGVGLEFRMRANGPQLSSKSAFARALQFKSEALNLVAVARVRRGARFVAPGNSGSVRLKDELAVLARDDPQAFLTRCGDSFVSAIHSGAEIYAHLEFRGISTDTRDKLSETVTFDFIFGSASAASEQFLRKYRDSRQLTLWMTSSGGTGVPLPVNEKDLLERVRNLSIESKDAPSNHSIALTGYDQLSNWPPERTTTLPWSMLRTLSRQLMRYQTLYRDMAPMLDSDTRGNYLWTFPDVTEASIALLRDNLKDVVLPALQNRIHECTSAGSCEIPTQAAASDYEIRAKLPVLKSSVVEYQELTEATAQYISAASKLAELGGPRTTQDGNRVTLLKPLPGVREALEQARAAAQARRAKANGELPSGVARARYREWIELPNKHRCDTSGAADCLSQAALESYRRQIFGRVF